MSAKIRVVAQNTVIIEQSALSVISDYAQDYEHIDALNSNPIEFIITDDNMSEYEYDYMTEHFTIESEGDTPCTVDIVICNNDLSVWTFSDKRFITSQNIAQIADVVDAMFIAV
jgi:heptaprenylglyceryl phosphate synthase